MKFPFEATTKAGEKVMITGFFTGYKKPWCGFIHYKLGDKSYSQAETWHESGAYTDSESTFDLIDLPQQTGS